jgi:uncharacterized protein YjiS (DUF1127 family)
MTRALDAEAWFGATPRSKRPPGRRFARLPPGEPPTPALACALASVVAWLARQRQRAELVRLDDRMLADIGISRAEAVREGRRWS